MGLDGFYEVQISNSYCKDLALGWGLLPEVVRREVERDNFERQEAAIRVLETQTQENADSGMVFTGGSEGEQA